MVMNVNYVIEYSCEFRLAHMIGGKHINNTYNWLSVIDCFFFSYRLFWNVILWGINFLVT